MSTPQIFFGQLSALTSESLRQAIHDTTIGNGQERASAEQRSSRKRSATKKRKSSPLRTTVPCDHAQSTTANKTLRLALTSEDDKYWSTTRQDTNEEPPLPEEKKSPTWGRIELTQSKGTENRLEHSPKDVKDKSGHNRDSLNHLVLGNRQETCQTASNRVKQEGGHRSSWDPIGDDYEVSLPAKVHHEKRPGEKKTLVTSFPKEEFQEKALSDRTHHSISPPKEENDKDGPTEPDPNPNGLRQTCTRKPTALINERTSEPTATDTRRRTQRHDNKGKERALSPGSLTSDSEDGYHTETSLSSEEITEGEEEDEEDENEEDKEEKEEAERPSKYSKTSGRKRPITRKRSCARQYTHKKKEKKSNHVARVRMHNPTTRASESLDLGSFPSLVYSGLVTALTRPNSGLGDMPPSEWLLDPDRPALSETETTEDLDKIFNEINILLENKSQRYPPTRLSLHVASTIRCIEKHLRCVNLRFPISYARLNYATANICRELDIAPMRCVALLEQIDNGYLITPTGDLPAHLHGRDPSIREKIQPKELDQRMSPRIHMWLRNVLLPLSMKLHTYTLLRNIELWEIIAEVGSARFGWAWTPGTFKHLANTQSKDCPWEVDLRAALHKLRRHNLRPGKKGPKYNLRREHLLEEDLQPVLLRKGPSSAYRSRQVMLDVFSPDTILQHAGPERRKTNAHASTKVHTSWEETHLLVDTLMSWHAPTEATRPHRTLTLTSSCNVQLAKDKVEEEISRSLFGFPFRLQEVNNQDTTVTLVFHTEDMLFTALCTVNVWIETLSSLYPTTLHLDPTITLPAALRTFTFLDPRRNNFLQLEEITKAVKKEQIQVEASLVKTGKWHITRRKLLIQVTDWQNAMRLLQKTHFGDEGRMILDYKTPEISWCRVCNRPGHISCGQPPAEQCTVCPMLHSDLKAHPFHGDNDQRHPDLKSVKHCVAQQLLRVYLDQITHVATGQAVVGQGIYSQTISGVLFRLRQLQGSIEQAYGLPSPIPPKCTTKPPPTQNKRPRAKSL